MQNAIIFAAMIGTHPTTPEMLTFSGIGFCVVLFVLMILSFVMSLIGYFFRMADSIKAKKAEEAKAAAAKKLSETKSDVVSKSAEADDPRLVAVIAAAVAVALEGAKHRITSIKSVTPNFAWSREGRQEIFSSRSYRPVRKS